jgi:hypothetical protein
MVDMLSVEKRLAGPLPPPALRIVVARFSVGDVVGPRRRVERRIVSPLWLSVILRVKAVRGNLVHVGSCPGNEIQAISRTV